MKFEDYRSGSYKRQYEYESFSPTLVNQTWTWDNPKISTLLEDATRALGELSRKVKINGFAYLKRSLR